MVMERGVVLVVVVEILVAFTPIFHIELSSFAILKLLFIVKI